jgi:hypothetical protein
MENQNARNTLRRVAEQLISLANQGECISKIDFHSSKVNTLHAQVFSSNNRADNKRLILMKTAREYSIKTAESWCQFLLTYVTYMNILNILNILIYGFLVINCHLMLEKLISLFFIPHKRSYPLLPDCI